MEEILKKESEEDLEGRVNTIILYRGYAYVDMDALESGKFRKNFKPGDLIRTTKRFKTPDWKVYEPEEMERWHSSYIDRARTAVRRYWCNYDEELVSGAVEEYGLRFCYCDDDGKILHMEDEILLARECIGFGIVKQSKLTVLRSIIGKGKIFSARSIDECTAGIPVTLHLREESPLYAMFGEIYCRRESMGDLRLSFCSLNVDKDGTVTSKSKRVKELTGGVIGWIDETRTYII
jgi:hypothetical protein